MRSIKFFSVQVGNHTDSRRSIDDVVIPDDIDLPSPIRQLKIVSFTEESIERKVVVGNHYHTNGRWELFVVTGTPSGAIFRMAHRESRAGGVVHQCDLHHGDAVFVPEGVSHAFIPLEAGKLVGFAPKAYDAKDDVADVLFSPQL